MRPFIVVPAVALALLTSSRPHVSAPANRYVNRPTTSPRRSRTSPAGSSERHRATGFTGGASAGWHAFTTFLAGLALVVGWLLPFLGLAALIGLPALWLRRRRRSTPSGTS